MMRRNGKWFCNTGTRLGRGWLPITPDLRLADCGDWPPIRVLGNLPRFGACQECHGSQIQVANEPGRPHATRYVSLTINCESCHGPGRHHVERMRAGGGSEDIGMEALATRTKDGSLEICFRCHALKDAVAPAGFLPGMDLDAHYSTKLPLLSDEPVFPDGRIRTFAYQQGHLSSACYLSGSMTCVDCHDPHSQHYRDANYRPIPGRFDDAQCTACHPSKAADVERHTRHAPQSNGSRCVACHMPYLQEPEVGTQVPYARSDHTVPIPRPAFDAALGIEVACQACHRHMDTAALERQTEAWWGTIKPHRPLVAGLERLRRRPSPDSALAVLRVPPGDDAVAEFLALGTGLRDVLRPDIDALDEEVIRRLQAAAASPDHDVAAVGLAALHYARGNDRAVRRFLVRRLGSLGASEPAVRARWAVLLGFLGDRHREKGDLNAAIATYRKSLEIRPGDGGTLVNLGLAHAARGDPPAAEEAFLSSLHADSSNSLAWVNLGMSRAGRRDEPGALAAYESAIRMNPADGLAYFNLGNLHLRADRAAEAAAQYERAIATNPELAQAHFNLARARITLGNLAGARAALRDGLALDPANEPAKAALQEIESALRRD
jgi:Flp pilus assembly protein TadD